MRVNVVSDLHLEFGDLELPGGDVLILSGDVVGTTRIKPTTPPEKFFNEQCAKYRKVFYVLGNHEHYHGKFHKTADLTRSLMPSNVTLLEKQAVEFEGVVFMGATLWTNCNNGDSLTMYTLKHSMNDYKVIQNFYKAKGLYYKLTPEATFEEHVKTLQVFRDLLEQHKDKPVVVITHHAPSFNSIHEQYKGELHMNGGYASDLSEFILDHPQIKVWTHGHVHNPVDYMIGSTRVMCNPRGYKGHERRAAEFDPSVGFDI